MRPDYLKIHELEKDQGMEPTRPELDLLRVRSLSWKRPGRLHRIVAALKKRKGA